MRVLFAASEAAPFAKSGGLGDVIGSLPIALKGKKCEVSCVVPLYEKVAQSVKDKMTFIANIFVPVAWRKQYCGLFLLEQDGVKWYFIDNEYYFKRGDTLYGCYDDAERFAFFSRAILEVLPLMGEMPDVIHCHDWQTALVPVYLRLMYHEKPEYDRIKTVFTIHNIEYQGKFGRDIMGNVLGISEAEFENGFMEHSGAVNFMKSAIVCSDWVTTVSPSYAGEIQSAEFAHGLETVLEFHKGKVSGILNGISKKAFNPKTDKRLFAKYSADDLSGKAVNKAELQKMLNLPVNESVPLVGMVTRLVSHKGIDMVTQVLNEILERDLQLIVVGTGDWQYEQFLRDLQWQYPSKLSVHIAFNTDLAQKVYAGCDMFLMPSRSEPCGLAQMIALNYGTIPIVRATGGLKDTVAPYQREGKTGNGFSFERCDAYEMLATVDYACEIFREKEAWEALVKQGIAEDFTWKNSAKQYQKLYEGLIS